jgi:hypothetical protein
MPPWFDVLLNIWGAAGIICFIGWIISAVFKRSASSLTVWVLPFYLFWMLPIYLMICIIAGAWWLWDALFKAKHLRNR